MQDAIKGTMISYRPDIKVLDATIRDGGLVNNFEFTDQFVRDLYQANVRAGVDVMEIGYLADPELKTNETLVISDRYVYFDIPAWKGAGIAIPVFWKICWIPA